MKIKRLSIYQVDLPMKEGAYSWSTQSFSAFDSTVVVIGMIDRIAIINALAGPSVYCR